MVGEISFTNEEMKDAFVKAYNNAPDKSKNGMTIQESSTDSTKIYFNWLNN